METGQFSESNPKLVNLYGRNVNFYYHIRNKINENTFLFDSGISFFFLFYALIISSYTAIFSECSQYQISQQFAKRVILSHLGHI